MGFEQKRCPFAMTVQLDEPLLLFLKENFKHLWEMCLSETEFQALILSPTSVLLTIWFNSKKYNDENTPLSP